MISGRQQRTSRVLKRSVTLPIAMLCGGPRAERLPGRRRAKRPLPGSGGLARSVTALGSGPSRGDPGSRAHSLALSSRLLPEGRTTGRGTAVGGPPVPVANPTPLQPCPARRLGATPRTGQAQSLTLNVSGPTALSQTIGVDTRAAGCVNRASGAICQAALALLPGRTRPWSGRMRHRAQPG